MSTAVKAKVFISLKTPMLDQSKSNGLITQQDVDEFWERFKIIIRSSIGSSHFRS
jgi:hypothetical protein